MGNTKTIGIGWDVGGWYGDKNAITITELEGENSLKISHLNGLNSFNIIQHLDKIIQENQDTKIILGIDSPLGFPNAFTKLISEPGFDHSTIMKLLDGDQSYRSSPLAFRTTEMVIKQVFDKNALSASFDNLTNNTTLAISVIRFLQREYGFKCIPFDSHNSDTKSIIVEVYPAITPASYTEKFIKNFDESNYSSKDQADSVICSILALGYDKGYLQSPEEFKDEELDQEVIKKEGWIYFVKR